MLADARNYITNAWWAITLPGVAIMLTCLSANLIGGFFKYVFGKRFVFDHHDINPELYEAKFGRRDLGWKLMVLLERLTYRVADILTGRTSQTFAATSFTCSCVI